MPIIRNSKPEIFKNPDFTSESTSLKLPEFKKSKISRIKIPRFSKIFDPQDKNSKI